MRIQAPAAILLAILAFALSACNDDTVQPPSVPAVPAALGVPVKLRIGQTASYEGGTLKVAFGDLLEDSRCPLDEFCIDAGEVRVRMAAAREEFPPVRFDLVSSSSPSTIYDYAGFRIEYLNLEPYPSHWDPPQRSERQLSIVVTAL